jgi:predicted O-methyltransferase YrrM
MPITGPLIKLLKGVGVEVGVWHGEGAKYMLENCPEITRLYLIDPYEKAYEFNECKLPPQGFKENAFKDAITDAVKNTMKWSEKAWFIFARSVEAVKTIDEPLDFVYIDANHDYKYVLEDCNTWLPKIKKGGIISGHDYNRSPDDDVKNAVNSFIESKGLVLTGSVPDWWCYVR